MAHYANNRNPAGTKASLGYAAGRAAQTLRVSQSERTAIRLSPYRIEIEMTTSIVVT